jgi:hypothetical protein
VNHPRVVDSESSGPPPEDGAASPRRASPQRRAALIATAIALPITVVLAFILTAGRADDSNKKSASDKPLAAVTVVAPPTPTDAILAGCTKVFEKLPVQLGPLNPRKTDSDSGFVAAWGDPAIVIRCGVSRPTAAVVASNPELQDVNGVLWQPDLQKNQVVYTTFDRAVYVEVTVPANQDQPLPLLAAAITTLPATCTGQDAAGNKAPGLPICKSS